MTRDQSRFAVLALTVQSAVLGYNWVVMKVGLQYADTWSFAALRFGLGAVVLLIAWVFLGERLRRLQCIALGPAVAGLVLIIDPADLGGSLQSKLLAIGAGAAWGAGAVWAKKMLRGPDVDVLNLSGWQMLFGSIPLVIVALVIPSHHVTWSGQFMGALAYNVFIATALAWLLWLYVIKLLPAGLAGLGTLMTPVIGIVASIIQMGERLEGLEGAGIALILASLFPLVLEGLLPGKSPPGG